MHPSCPGVLYNRWTSFQILLWFLSIEVFIFFLGFILTISVLLGNHLILVGFQFISCYKIVYIISHIFFVASDAVIVLSLFLNQVYQVVFSLDF